MTCDTIQEKIPQLIRRELDGYERAPVINHLQQCSGCLSEYKSFLHLYYAIDLEIVTKPIPSLALSPVNSISGHPSKSTVVDRFFRTKFFYAVAAVMILFISIFLFILINDHIQKVNSVQNPPIPSDRTDTITSRTGLNEYISSSQLNSILAQQKISVSLLEQNLLALQNKGIIFFNITQVVTMKSLQESTGFENIGNKSLPVDGCLNKIKIFKKYKSQLTFSELVSFINTIDKEGA